MVSGGNPLSRSWWSASTSLVPAFQVSVKESAIGYRRGRDAIEPHACSPGLLPVHDNLLQFWQGRL